MHIFIKPLLPVSSKEIDLGKVEFPKQWLQIPLPKKPRSQTDHTCAVLGKKWCDTNGIDTNAGSMYRFDRAVWAVTIINSLLFDCESGNVVVHFVHETPEEEYAIVSMSSKLLVDLRGLVKHYQNNSENPDTLLALDKMLLSFCIDAYSTCILRKLKLIGCIPANYFIWIARMKRKEMLNETCLRTKEMADVLETHFGVRMDPELADWVRHHIDESSRDLLEYVLAHSCRIPRKVGSSSDTIRESSSPEPPGTPNGRLSDSSSISSDDSPTPVEEIDLYMHYRNDFDLTNDLLRYLDPKRMARLLPPKLSRRGLNMDEPVKGQLEELEAMICFYMNATRKLEKLIADEERKEKELLSTYLPVNEREDLARSDKEEGITSEKTYNLRAERSNTLFFDSHGKRKKGKKSRKSSRRSFAKYNTKRVKTPEEYEEEWKRRQDSPYPRLHAESINGKSACQMVFPNHRPSDSMDLDYDVADLRRRYTSKETKKRKLDTICEDSEMPIRKKLKLMRKVAEMTLGPRDDKQTLEEDDHTEAGDLAMSESVSRAKKKSKRAGKDLGHRGNRKEELDDSVPPSTAEYLASLRATYSPAVGSEEISHRELQALSLVATTAASQPNPLQVAVPCASSSASRVDDSSEDLEPGWEIKIRSPLSSKTLSHASSTSNTTARSQTSTSGLPGRTRPPLRRENTRSHPNAFFVGIGASRAVSPPSADANSTQEDIPVPASDHPASAAGCHGVAPVTSTEQELNDDDDDFVLGILSPERHFSPLEEEEERSSIFDETCSEIDELASSPEDSENPPSLSQIVPSAISGMVEGATKHCEPSKSREIGQRTYERIDYQTPEEEDSPSSGDEARAGEVAIGDHVLLQGDNDHKSVERAIAIRDDLRNEEVEAVSQKPSALDKQVATQEKMEDEVHFVKGLMERCGMVVHKSGSPASRELVTPPVSTDHFNRNSMHRKQRKLKQRNKKSIKSDQKAETMSSLVADVTADLTRSTSISILPSATIMTTEVTSSGERPASTPASTCADTRATRVSSEEAVRQTSITKVYPSKRGARQKIHSPAPNWSSMSMACSGGISVSRPGSPHKASADGCEGSAPLGVHQFLNSLLRESGVEDFQVTCPIPNEAIGTSNCCKETMDQSQEQSKISTRTGEHDGQLESTRVPLSPGGGGKQKRYPGMLAFSESSGKPAAVDNQPTCVEDGLLQVTRGPLEPAPLIASTVNSD